MFEWQSALYDKWKAQNFIGLCRAPTGAGKTLAGVVALKRFIEEHPDCHPLILSPSAKVNKSWHDELERHGLRDVPIMTYQTAVNAMARKGVGCDVMICDECHRLATPVQGRVLEMMPKAVLGLSATPSEAREILGEPLIDVPISEANVCPFTIHYVTFQPTASEMDAYRRATDAMERRALSVTDGNRKWLKPKEDSEGWNSYDSLSRKRREVCYLMPSRIGHTASIVKDNIGRRMVVYFERTEQVFKLRDALWSDRIRCAVHVQEESTLDDFESGKVDILIACKSLREGWNDPTISCIVMGSINTRSIVNTQTIGRALRMDPDNPAKHADIYLLMANGTSDCRVEKSLDYPKEYISHEVIRWSMSITQVTTARPSARKSTRFTKRTLPGISARTARTNWPGS